MVKELILVCLLLIVGLSVPSSAAYLDTFNLTITDIPEWYLVDYRETNVSKLSGYNISVPADEVNSSFGLYGSNDGVYFDNLNNESYQNWTADIQYEYNISPAHQQFYRYYVFYMKTGFENLTLKELNLTLTAAYISPFIVSQPVTLSNFMGQWLPIAAAALLVVGGFWIPMSALLGVLIASVYAGMNMQNFTGYDPWIVTAVIIIGLLVFISGIQSNRRRY